MIGCLSKGKDRHSDKGLAKSIRNLKKVEETSTFENKSTISINSLGQTNL